MPMEATLVVAMTMQRYRLDLMPGQTVKAHSKGTLRPRPGVWMTPHNTTGTAICPSRTRKKRRRARRSGGRRPAPHLHRQNQLMMSATLGCR